MNHDWRRQLADAFVEAMGFAEDERVRAVLVIGSSASGEADEFSDIDMMVAVQRKGSASICLWPRVL